MGSIPALISADLVPAAGIPAGSSGGQSAPGNGAPTSTSDGFGHMFAEQIADVVATGAGVALGAVPPGPSVPTLPPALSLTDNTEFSLKNLTLTQLFDESSVPVLSVPTTSVSSPDVRTDLAASPAPAPAIGLSERALLPAPFESSLKPPTLMSTDVNASMLADATAELRAPTLKDAVALGLASIEPSNSGDVPFIIQSTRPTPLVTIEQLPRNGRPVEAQPDHASYFVVLPPSPLAQAQARLVQTLSSPSEETVPRAASLAESTNESPALPALAALVAPFASGSAAGQEPLATSGVVIAPPVARRTQVSSLTATVAEVALGEKTSGQNTSGQNTSTEVISREVISREVIRSEKSAESAPLTRSYDPGMPRLVMPMRSVLDVENPSVLSGETSTPPGLPSLSLGVPPPPDKHVPSHHAAIRADDDANAESIATPTVQPAVSAAATSLPERPGSDAFVMAPSLAPLLETSVLDESPLAAVMIPLAGPPGSQIRTPAPPTVSERARLQDPLRGIDSANQSVSATSSTPPAAVIPFATPTVSGGATAAILPNPLERNIARQLTQQLSAPLGSLAGPGAQRKAAVDKSLIIRLTPPDLGTVRIEISQRNGDLVIRMHAEDPAVRQAIERMLPTLRTDLRQADSPLQHITVESSGQDRSSGDRNSSDRNGADDRNAWQGQQQGQQQRQDRSPDGGRPSSRGDGERPVFSLSGMPTPEPITIAPRSRSLGGSTSTTGVDALA